MLVALLVLAFRRFERFATPPVAGPALWRTLVAAVGVACGVLGMIGFAVVGFRGIADFYTVTVIGVPMTSATSFALVLASAVLTSLAVKRASVAP